MKIEELSVGNWVLYKDSPAKIADITRENHIGVYQNGKYLILNLEDLKPMPLTNEILELNGAIKHYYEEYSYTYSFRNAGCFLEKVYESDHYYLEMYDGSLEIRYVHELQNLLKLFKNWKQEFKIE